MEGGSAQDFFGGTYIRLEILTTPNSQTTDEPNLQPFKTKIFCFTLSINFCTNVATSAIDP